jgi:hypothetical protein
MMMLMVITPGMMSMMMVAPVPVAVGTVTGMMMVAVIGAMTGMAWLGFGEFHFRRAGTS